MFLLFSILSTLGYALQTTLMVPFFRRLDPLVASASRGLSLGISMLPLLVLAPDGSLRLLLSHLPLLLAASLLAALGNWSAGHSFRHLPVGVAMASQLSALVVCATVLARVLFSEELLLAQYTAISFIVLANILFSVPGARQAAAPVVHADFTRGLYFCAIFGFFLAAAYILIARLSRLTHPLSAAYSWEFSIGVVSLLMIFVQNHRSGKSPLPSLPDFLKILCCAAPTAIGSGCYAEATLLGSPSLVIAVLSTEAVFACVLSYLLHHEKLHKLQMLGIALVIIAVLALKINTP